MKLLLSILFFVPLQVVSQNFNNKSIESIEILSKAVIDETRIIIDSQSAIEINENKTVPLTNEDVILIKEYISDLFITKKYNVFNKIEKANGFRYSELQKLIITVQFNESEKDIYNVNLTPYNYKVEYSEEFKKLLKVLFKLRR